MNFVLTYLILAMLVEAVIESAKIVYNQDVYWENIASFFLGAVVAYAFGLDLIDFLGLTLEAPDVVGLILNMLLVGVFVMRGSGFFNDFLTRVNQLRE